MSELKKLLGKRIAAFRQNLKLTQFQLSEKIDMSPSAIAEIETGVTFPRPETLEKMRRIFNCEYSDLFSFSDSENVDDAYNEICQSVDYLYMYDKRMIPILKVFVRLLRK